MGITQWSSRSRTLILSTWGQSCQRPSSSNGCWTTRGCRQAWPGAGHDRGIPKAASPIMSRMLAAIASNDPLRGDLRFIALLHDAFKAEIRPDEPWSPATDHAVLARDFAKHYADELLLTVLELHDEAYWIWRTGGTAEHALFRLFERLPD